MAGCIYAITNVEDGKFTTYVGQTSRPIGIRQVEHVKTLNESAHCNPYLQRAWNKYGESAFEFVILQTDIPLECLIDCEQDWIDSFAGHFCVYNMNPAQNGTISEEARHKMSIAKLGTKRGPHSEKTKEKIRASLMGHAVSEETRQKIGNAGQGRSPSEETRQKLSDASKRYYADPEARRRHSEKMKEVCATPEMREVKRKAAQKRWSFGRR